MNQLHRRLALVVIVALLVLGAAGRVQPRPCGFGYLDMAAARSCMEASR